MDAAARGARRHDGSTTRPSNADDRSQPSADERPAGAAQHEGWYARLSALMQAHEARDYAIVLAGIIAAGGFSLAWVVLFVDDVPDELPTTIAQVDAAALIALVVQAARRSEDAELRNATVVAAGAVVLSIASALLALLFGHAQAMTAVAVLTMFVGLAFLFGAIE